MTFSPAELALLRASDRLVDSRTPESMELRQPKHPTKAKPPISWFSLASLIARRPRTVGSIAAQYRIRPCTIGRYLHQLEREGRVKRVNNQWSLA